MNEVGSIENGVVVRPDGARISWDVRGRGPCVLLVHGLGSNRRTWREQVDVVAQAGFRVAQLDLRGSGASTPAPEGQGWGFDELYGDVQAVVAATMPERFHLVGHSLGGMLCQRLALELGPRVCSLALVSTTSHNGRRATSFARAMVELSTGGFAAVWQSPEARGRIEPILAEAFPGMPLPLELLRRGLEQPDHAQASAWRACEEFSTKDELPNLACPVLVAHGTNDPLIPFVAGQRIHELIPDSEWHVEAGAGHGVPSRRASSFNPVLLRLLQGDTGRKCS